VFSASGRCDLRRDVAQVWLSRIVLFIMSAEHAIAARRWATDNRGQECPSSSSCVLRPPMSWPPYQAAMEAAAMEATTACSPVHMHCLLHCALRSFLRPAPHRRCGATRVPTLSQSLRPSCPLSAELQAGWLTDTTSPGSIVNSGLPPLTMPLRPSCLSLVTKRVTKLQ